MILWRGTSIPPHPPGIMGYVADGIAGRGLLWDSDPGILGGDAGGPSAPHHIQCGGGRSGPTMGSGDGIESGRTRREQTGGTTPKRPLLRG